MGPNRRSIVDWGVRYVGYPYIWGGEWGFDGPSRRRSGSQPGPGFDCSGLSWWALRRDDGGVLEDLTPTAPRGGGRSPNGRRRRWPGGRTIDSGTRH